MVVRYSQCANDDQRREALRRLPDRSRSVCSATSSASCASWTLQRTILEREERLRVARSFCDAIARLLICRIERCQSRAIGSLKTERARIKKEEAGCKAR